MPALFGESFPFDKSVSAHALQQPGLALPSSSNEIELEPINQSNRRPHSNDSNSAVSEAHIEGESAPTGSHTTRLTAGSSPVVVTDLQERSGNPTSSLISDSELDLEDSQMLRKARKSPSSVSDRPTSADSGRENSYANGDMESRMEMRRKHPSLDFPTNASQTAHLMSRESFTLDDEPLTSSHAANSNASFFQLPRQDRRNFLLLVLLYFLQGIPMGLASGSVPFLLKKHLSYSQLGVFSLASYPYSLKLLWSPIVDAVWHPKLGRRKSWIMPIQMCSGLGMIYLGGKIKHMMVAAGASDGSGVWTFTWWWFFLVFLCATQDIAVDGEWKCTYRRIRLLTIL